MWVKRGRPLMVHDGWRGKKCWRAEGAGNEQKVRKHTAHFYGCKIISVLCDAVQQQQFIRLNNEYGVFWSGVFAAAKRGKDVIFMITCFCISQQVWLLSDAWTAEQWLQFSLLSLSLTFGFIPAWLRVSTHLCHRMFSTVRCFTQKSWNYLHEPLTDWLSGSLY